MQRDSPALSAVRLHFSVLMLFRERLTRGEQTRGLLLYAQRCRRAADERLRRHYENRKRDYLLIAQGTRPLLNDQRRGHAARQTADRRVYSVYPADNGEECKQLPGKNQHRQQSNAPVGDKL